MGGSGALLFSHLATSVVSFCPQVELVGYPMVGREDLTVELQQQFTAQLLDNVGQCLEQGGRISVHVGDYHEDNVTLRSVYPCPNVCRISPFVCRSFSATVSHSYTEVLLAHCLVKILTVRLVSAAMLTDSHIARAS